MILLATAEAATLTPSLFTELAKQAPTLVVLVLLVYIFLNHLQKEGEANRKVTEKHTVAIQEHTRVINQLLLERKSS